MSPSPLQSLRLLAVLAVFLASIFGHGMAMAAAPMPGEVQAAIYLTTDADAHHGVPCSHHHCGGQSQGCCLMGQCLLGVPVIVGLSFRQPDSLAPEASTITAVADAAPEVPFRPPALM